MTAVAINDFGSLLSQLLAQAGWNNTPKAILEATPHLADQLSESEIIDTLRNLDIPFTVLERSEADISQSECPALVLSSNGDAFAVIGIDAQGLVVLRPGSDGQTHRPATKDKCFIVRIEPYTIGAVEKHTNSVESAFSALKPMLPWLLLSSLLVNTLGLLAPLLIMAIYDRVIPSGSVEFLIAIACGAAIILATDFVLRFFRTRAIAFAGRRAEQALSLALFKKLMKLPLSQLQKSSVDQQISRFRQFEGLREIFTGQALTSLLDLPFVIIFLSVLCYIAPQIGLLVICVATVFLIHGLITTPIQQRLDAEAHEATRRSRELIQDAVLHQRAIVGLGLAERWQERSRPLIDLSETATRSARSFQAAQQSFTQSLTGLATVASIVISTLAVLNGDMSFGALIAVIALVSKIIAPINSLHGNAAQMISFWQSKAQANRVLNLQEEFEIGLGHTFKAPLTGKISFIGVTHRPDPLNAPVLAQANLRIEAGETVLILGNDVTGRTSVLDLVDGLSTPIGGSIELDGIDIRQIAKDELRSSVSYATYAPGLLYGTIAQNFRLADPRLGDADVEDALKRLGLTQAVENLPDGMETRLSEGVLANMPPDMVQGISLARALSRHAPIHLFSEPTNDLNGVARAGFKSWLSAERGNRTILVATSDRSLLPFGDRFVFLDSGRVVVNDIGDAGLKKIQAVLSNVKG